MPGPDNPFASAEWGEKDSQLLRQFLKTTTGKRLIFRLRADRPVFLPGGQVTVDQAAIFGCIAQGYEMAVNNIFEYLVAPIPNPEKDTAGTYPDLTRDAVWPEELQVKSFQAPGQQTSVSPDQTVPNEAESEMGTHTNPSTESL